jgi:aminopeptidase N
LGTPQEIPADDPFWDVVIGDPGIPNLFHGAVYTRGAMTLQTLRNQVGDRDFFRILRAWATRRAGGNGTTAQFVALAERISGQQLDALFDAWLFTPGKPALGPAAAAVSASTAVTGAARSAAGSGSAGRRRASPPPAPAAPRSSR